MASLCYAATGISFTCSMCLVSYHSLILNSKKLKGAKKKKKTCGFFIYFSIKNQYPQQDGSLWPES